MLKTALMGLEILNPNIDNFEKSELFYHTKYCAELKHKTDDWSLYIMKTVEKYFHFQLKHKSLEGFDKFCEFYFDYDHHIIENVVFYL